jgi:pilus assembly protein CpaE
MARRILIVDDDIETVRLVGITLEREGYEIQAATTGKQALQKSADNPPDLFILDVMMPGMDGYKTARLLRERPETKDVPILFFSAKGSINDRVSGFQSGGDDYLAKPIHPKELVTHVKRLLQKQDEKAKEEEEDELLDQATILKGEDGVTQSEEPEASEEEARAEAGSPATEPRVFALLPVRGGIGNSTLAVNLAFEMIQAIPEGEQVVLVELTDARGSVATQLGLPGERGLSPLSAADALTLDEERVMQQVIHHPSGLHLLPGSSRPTGLQASLTPEFVETLLEILRGSFEHIILDLPPILNDTVAAALRQANHVVTTIDTTKATRALAAEFLQVLEELEVKEEQSSIAVIQRAPSRRPVRPAQIQEELGRRLLIRVPPASDLVEESWEEEVPLVVGKPDSETAHRVREAAQALLKSVGVGA